MRALAQAGHELGPEPGRQKPPPTSDQHGAPRRPARGPRQRRPQGRPVERAGRRATSRFSLSAMRRGQEHARQHRHQREREDQRPEQGEDDGQRHRPEQLPLDPLERQDRQVDDHDDELAEHRRPPDLDRGVADDVEPATRPARPRAEAPRRVLDHDDRAVDDQAEVDGAEAHQAAGDADPQHEIEREEHRERDRRGHDQPRAQVAQEDEEHGDDEQRALEEVRPHRVQHVVDEVRAVVDGRRPRRPAAGVFRISSSRISSRRVTSWLFSPMSMKPSPSTTSPLPSAVTAPRRISRPSTTRATSRTRIGTPSRAATTMLSDVLERA